MRNSSILPAGVMLAVLLCLSGAAAAQSPAVNPEDAASARAQQERQATQPGNNAPVWRDVRYGEPKISQVRGRETNVLIQSEGQTWREARVPLATTGGFAFSLALLGILGFYLWRGPIQLTEPPTGRRIERFTRVQRIVHWTVAIAFTTLGVTGLIITFGKHVMLPVFGYTVFSVIAMAAKILHNFVGPVFVVVLPVMIAMFLKSNLFKSYDWPWIKRFGGMMDRTGRSEVPSGKANAGQKMLFWLMVVAVGITAAVTGLILDFPNFDQTRQTMQIANGIHMVAGIGGVILLAFHIYLGTIGMRGAYDAMRHGYVDETWAKQHHRIWYDEVMSGKASHGGRPVNVVEPGSSAARPL
jgi:formate dehydrogenase subunit gamma